MSRSLAAGAAGSRSTGARRLLTETVPRLSATVVACWAALCAVVALFPALRHALWHPLMFVSENVLLILPNLAYATFLALLAAALSTGKRAGWRILVVVLVVNLADAAGEITVRPRSSVAIAVATLLLVVVLLSRNGYQTRVRSRSVLKAVAVLVPCLLLSIGLGFLLLELFHGTLPSDQRLLWSLNRATGGVIGPRAFDGRPAEWVSDLIGFLGGVSLLGAFAVVFQSQALRATLTAPEERAVRTLLDEYGRHDSLGYFATRRDKAAVFSEDGRAAVLHRVEVGVCLASGDPVGDTGSWPDAIARWQRLARDHGWSPAVLGASERGAHQYERAGLTALQLGDEAIIEVAEFNRRRPGLPTIQRAVRRARRHGVTVRIRRHHQVPAAELDEIRRLADAWRGDEPERGFSMALGRLGDPADGDCLLAEALAPDGSVLALLSFVPWGRSGISLDLMRRDPNGPNGVIEYLVSMLAEQGAEHRVARISLNFAVLRSVFEEGGRIGAGPLLRGWRRVLLVLSRWWQLEALYRSNVKYEPAWFPRFLCYDDARMIPRVGVAAGIAEGFIDIPERIRTRRPLQPEHLSPERAEEIVAAVAAHQELRARGRRRPEQVRIRMERMAAMAAAGRAPYPAAGARPSATAAALAADDGTAVTVAGRLVALRDHGGVVFAELRDWHGSVQCVLQAADLGPDLARFVGDCDLGDLVELRGTVGASRSGERSVLATSWRMLAKCLHPLPGRVNGPLAPELRVRQRQLDLAMSDDAREHLRRRAQVLRGIRETLHRQDYLEVETPVLHTVHGGANARPFTTYSNAYDLPLSLRIAPELYLKRLCVGGVERVYELGRVFRNEGADRTHNPEFTTLEAYAAHGDYTTMRRLCQELVTAAAIAVHGRPLLVHRDADGGARELAVDGAWAVRTVHGAVSEAIGVPVDWATPAEELRALAGVHGIAAGELSADQIVLELYEALVEPTTVAPTFYTDFPTSVCPLTRARDDNPALAERWDLVVLGMELATAYSELTDPVEQRRRLEQQSLLAAGGDPEAMVTDEQFLQALELGMPPTGGLGMGVDRLLMLLSGDPIRSTVTFPLVRPDAEETAW
ncbi:bifunctional lysylphosphatidylglycerol synthetase/lysine--tRNA ligase LysX [Nocardioides nitrophenolicus]|uniref:bifunctional lysylphosphatidylglycerol synthetase/lysine--tRNA ligase LysX n=1 Tax=Nocardioides nitrophenolicus TaxID=60489 RepID=UPI00195C9762|nr:bifunctional lysylphosphatidylglycerol synthetase/lysine--tRNA ligase LysX [Nocardioides nitrophenolicus]MBM7519081.1 lysyl-tRNA synthetase class 2 [Nocardioides nitrophenolicus]